jgi:AcrR family transcriptional regulator
MNALKTGLEKPRVRLLQAASRIFAEKGYQETTIAEICEQAKTNIAAVNYYFQGKECLYLESWRFAFNQELTWYPPDTDYVADATAEQRLSRRIKSLIKRVADDRSYSFAILIKEMALPTRLLADILENEIKPQHLKMYILIKECLGQIASDQEINYCHASIIGQCLQLLHLKQLHLTPNQYYQAGEFNDINAYADHVVRFSLGGISAIQSKNSALKPCK